MWVRNRTTKTNGVSCILQRGGAAVFTPEGQRQVKERIRYYQRNARVIMEALDRAGVRRWGGRNAPYVWMKCPAGMKSWDFFDRLLQDAQVIGTGSVLRTAVIFFYLSNEGVSLVENAAHLGLPVPAKLKAVLEQLHDRAEKDGD